MEVDDLLAVPKRELVVVVWKSVSGFRIATIAEV